MALIIFPSLAMAEDVAPPVIPATEVEAATPEPETPSASEDSSMYGNPSMDENLILASVSGVPDELRVIFSLGGQDIATVQGNQILRSEAFPQDQKMSLKMRIEGQGRLVGAKFGFEPFAAPVIPPVVPETIEPTVEPLEELIDQENPEENTDPAEVDPEENTDPENPVGNESTEEPTAPDTPESSEPVGQNTGNTDPGTGDTGATGDFAGESADAGENTDGDGSSDNNNLGGQI